jgi:hypothetical protein
MAYVPSGLSLTLPQETKNNCLWTSYGLDTVINLCVLQPMMNLVLCFTVS